ncbi:MAG: hypothetical protein RL608_515 [Bacteroidota bacterium]
MDRVLALAAATQPVPPLGDLWDRPRAEKILKPPHAANQENLTLSHASYDYLGRRPRH